MNPIRLLITDDQESVHELIRRYLALNELSRDAAVFVCRSMDELWIFFESGNRVDIVFLDLVLPPLLAPEVIACIPRIKKYCPEIVVLSGFVQFKEDALAAGASQFLDKYGDMATPQAFFLKVAKWFRELKGPSVASENIQKLREIITPSPKDPHG